jgi:hypothetical protein
VPFVFKRERALGQSTTFRARRGLYFGGFNSAHRYLIKVTTHLFFGAAELPQVLLNLLDSRPAFYFLECVKLFVLFHGDACTRNLLITHYVGS